MTYHVSEPTAIQPCAGVPPEAGKLRQTKFMKNFISYFNELLVMKELSC
jgi:hypothetical protein